MIGRAIFYSQNIIKNPHTKYIVRGLIIIKETDVVCLTYKTDFTQNTLNRLNCIEYL